LRLRITDEVSTYVYATSPMKFGGVAKEDLIVLLVPMATLHSLGLAPLMSLFISLLILWTYLKATANQAEGFLVHWFSAHVGELKNVTFIKNTPPLLRLVKGLGNVMDKVWISSGLPPSPSNCDIYER
jgi:hypothetical protein